MIFSRSMLRGYGSAVDSPRDVVMAATGFTFGTDGPASIIYRNDGTIESNGGWIQTYPTAGAGNNRWLRIAYVSGTNQAVTALGDWLELSTERTYTFSSLASSVGIYSAQIASDSGGNNILGTTEWTVEIIIIGDPGGG